MAKITRSVVLVMMLAMVVAFIAACANDPAPPTQDVAPPAQQEVDPPAQQETTNLEDHEPTDVMTADTAAEMRFQQSPFLDGRDLPPVDDRLPLIPKLVNEMPPEQLDFQVGQFGGTLRTVTQAIEWDADVFVMSNTPLLNSPGMIGREVTGNILYDWSASADQQTFTFHLREGLRWSDGVPVTMEDFRFTIESLMFNETYQTSVPVWLRSGGVPEGTPFRFEVVDDWTFRILFDRPYGGFPIMLSISGWRGHTDLLLPSHFLKPFHIDYATEEEMARWPGYIAEHSITEMGDDTWVNVLNHFRINNWDIAQRRGVGFPALTPWVLVDYTDTMRIFERNPFYFKVDPAGNQLPYIDRIESTIVQDMEMVQLMIISGEVDFARESTALINMPLYRQNEETGGFTTLMANMHVTPTDIGLNQTWAGGPPGYTEMVQDVRFRRALMMAIDRDLLVDALYFGFAEPTPWKPSTTFNQEAAIALFEEMGMERGADGFFMTPAGYAFDIIIEHGNEAPDINPMADLIAEMWSDVGINTTQRQIDGSLLGNRQNANELQARVIWTHTPMWPQGDNGIHMVGRLWDMYWHNVTRYRITHEDGTFEYVEDAAGETPPDYVLTHLNLFASLFQVSVDEAQNVLTQYRNHFDTYVPYFVPVYAVRQPVIVNSRLRNTTEDGFAIALNFSGEQLWFEQ